jgi:hypothetical protein
METSSLERRCSPRSRSRTCRSIRWSRARSAAVRCSVARLFLSDRLVTVSYPDSVPGVPLRDHEPDVGRRRRRRLDAARPARVARRRRARRAGVSGADADVVIVGAGPAGCATALSLVQRHPELARRAMVLDRATFPRDKVCGGGLSATSRAWLDRLGVHVDVPGVVAGDLRVVFDGFEREHRWRRPAIVVRRFDFDHLLVKAVRQRGVPVAEGTAVTDVSADPDGGDGDARGRRPAAREGGGGGGRHAVEGRAPAVGVPRGIVGRRRACSRGTSRATPTPGSCSTSRSSAAAGRATCGCSRR